MYIYLILFIPILYILIMTAVFYFMDRNLGLFLSLTAALASPIVLYKKLLKKVKK